MKISKELKEFTELAHANFELAPKGEEYQKGYWDGINFGGGYIEYMTRKPVKKSRKLIVNK